MVFFGFFEVVVFFLLVFEMGFFFSRVWLFFDCFCGFYIDIYIGLRYRGGYTLVFRSILELCGVRWREVVWLEVG